MRKKGISLIVLIITVVVIIILGTAIVVNLVQTNVIDSAKKAKLLGDIDTFKSELSVYHADRLVNDNRYKTYELFATKDSIENGLPEEKNINDVIHAMVKTDYPERFEVFEGRLVYIANHDKEYEKEKEWIEEETDIEIKEEPVEPLISLEGISVTYTPNRYLYSGTVKVTLGNLPEEATIQMAYTNTDSEEVIEETTEVTVNENQTITVIGIDKNGVEVTKTITVDKFDKIEPEDFEISYTASGGNIIVDASNAVDNQSGIKKYDYYISGSYQDDWQNIYFDGNNNYIVGSSDSVNENKTIYCEQEMYDGMYGNQTYSNDYITIDLTSLPSNKTYTLVVNASFYCMNSMYDEYGNMKDGVFDSDYVDIDVAGNYMNVFTNSSAYNEYYLEGGQTYTIRAIKYDDGFRDEYQGTINLDITLSGDFSSGNTYDDGVYSLTGENAEKYTFENIKDGDYQIYVEVYDEVGNSKRSTNTINVVSKADQELPVITSVTPKTGSVTINATDNVGIVGYAATTTNKVPTEFTSCDKTDELYTTISRLKANTTYYIWVKDKSENVSLAYETKTLEMPVLVLDDNLTFGQVNWSSTGKASVTVSTTLSGFYLQYSRNGTSWTSTSLKSTTISSIDNGTIIYVRLSDAYSNGNCTNQLQLPIAEGQNITEVVNLGDYIEYAVPSKTISTSSKGVSVNKNVSTNIHKENGGKWRVLYDDNTNGIQIVADRDVMYRVPYQSEVNEYWVNINGQQGYNNYISGLNTLASYYLNTTYATSARSLGSNPVSPESENTELDENGNKGADLNYTYDIKALEDSNITLYKNSHYVHLASRLGMDNGNYKIAWYDMGNSNYISSDISSGANNWSTQQAGFIPVITLRNDLVVLSGEGTEGSPYIIAVPTNK